MEEIIRIENETILSIIEAELKSLNIDYLIKKTDIIELPSNIDKMHCAILFSENKNKDIILEIYENIKISENIESEEKQVNGTNRILRNILEIAVFIFLIAIIVSQAISNKNLQDAINRPSNAYTYKYLNNGKETEVYSKKDNRLMEKYIDNNKNGINEKIEIYLTNGMILFYEDKNENGNYEYIGTTRDNVLLNESFSTKDNNIYDITYYYKDGKIEQKLIYDEETNEITIE